MSLKRGLQAEGFAVDLAFSGTDGLWLASEHPYDAIICDIMLPGMNGFKLCATLRAQKCWVPILMLTAKDGEYDHAEALDTGADDYLTKPFSFLVLVAHLRALLRRSTRERPVMLSAGDLILDLAAHRCARGAVEIDLTARELAIVEVLLRRAGDVVSKHALVEAVWDYDFEGGVNVVEVYVSRLRRKLDVPFGRSAIETVRGAGYRLDPSGG